MDGMDAEVMVQVFPASPCDVEVSHNVRAVLSICCRLTALDLLLGRC